MNSPLLHLLVCAFVLSPVGARAATYLVINTANLDVPATTEIVLAALQQRDLTPTPAALERVNSLARTARDEAAHGMAADVDGAFV